MYKSINSKDKLSSLEQITLANWQKNKTFEKSLELSDKEHIFYDGPPFPTGNPHHGTIFVSILKDSIARYFTMSGYSVPRRWGWDCHGLPIENAIEKKLGIKNKAEIEDGVGIEKFNAACREFVSSANGSWETYIDKIGRWTHYSNAYRTMDTNYMESVLWVFKECYNKELIYKDYRVTPYCYQCETSLSISDTRESDSTRPRQDPTLVVKFEAQDKINDLNTYYLAWTTTPWTLTSNLALAVGSDFDYVAIEHNGEALILAEKLLPKHKKLFGKKPVILQKFKGNELVSKRYNPILPYFKEEAKSGCFRILEADFVTLDDGVGIVHLAPAFGEDDYWICKSNNISVKNPVDASGCFTEKVSDFALKNVHIANKDVITLLKEQNKVVKHETMEHNYPHCWRCRTPLIYRAMDAWYFAIEPIKELMLKNNQDINWIPSHVKDGRFGKWLKGARDWNISRSRFWGTPIPVWECENKSCEHKEVLGSIDEISKKTSQKPTDLHKDVLDKLTYKCIKCESKMVRVAEVLDCWFESGSMPYGQCHYPFENKKWFEEHFPADFIVEYPGQLRGWFYYLHVLATALFEKPAFKNCVVHGTLLASDGSKISKSKKNYTDPMELLNKYGADALRIYLLSSPAASMLDMSFKDSGIEEQVKNVLLPIMNVYSFFVTYSNIDNFEGVPENIPQPKNRLDKWILAMLAECENKVNTAFSTYQLNQTLSPVLNFIDNLTNWYVRQSRDRFWQTGMSEDKQSAYETLYYVLNTTFKMLAPSAPFIAEHLFQNLTQKESVHLEKWPKIPQEYINTALIEEIALTRQITSLGLSLRQKLKIKVRQPLAKVKIALPKEKSKDLLQAQFDVIKNELNVKEIEFISNPEELATIRAVPNAKALGPKYGKDMQRIIKGAREGNVIENGDSITIKDAEKQWTIERSEITIGYEGKEGLDVASFAGVLIAYDKEITTELLEEGIANDLNRVIQDMRKEADYQISDRINLSIKGKLESKWLDHLYSAALADKSNITNSDLCKNITIQEREFDIAISKI